MYNNLYLNLELLFSLLNVIIVCNIDFEIKTKN